MSADYLTAHTELYFRTYMHTVFPLHAVLIETMCKAPRVPHELATVLEDIGQGYCRLADELNAELIRRNELSDETDADDTAEARIDEFVRTALAGLGQIAFVDGRTLDGRQAAEAHPAVASALQAALLIAKAGMPGAPAQGGGKKAGRSRRKQPTPTPSGPASATDG